MAETAGPEIRQITDADLAGWLRTRRTAFLQDGPVPAGQVQWWSGFIDTHRTLGAFVPGLASATPDECVATLRTFPVNLTVPGGGEVAADALTNVTVAGTHRRQGLLRGMLSRSLTEARERGEAVSILYSAEWPIYGRFGYWPASWNADYRVRCDRQATVGSPDAVAVRQVTLAEAGVIGPPLYERMRHQRAGHISRSHSQWQRHLGLDGVDRGYTREPVCIVAVNAAGAADGLLTWTAAEGNWINEPIDITVHELITTTAASYQALWDYLIHLDLVTGVRFESRAVDESLPWLLSDGRLVEQTGVSDALWLRILDVPAALSGRRYAVPDRLILQVRDSDFGGWAQGCYVLDGGPEHAECASITGSSADLTMSQRALAAVYLGGNSVGSQVAAGLIDENTPGALTRFSAMMHTDQQPWNATGF